MVIKLPSNLFKTITVDKKKVTVWAGNQQVNDLEPRFENKEKRVKWI